MDYKEEQSGEIEALQAIYSEELDSKWTPIRLHDTRLRTIQYVVSFTRNPMELQKTF